MNTLSQPPRRSSPYLRRMVASGEDFLLSPYQPHSWWHPEGRRSMVKRLEAKGFPALWGWLFITLTVDPDECSSPQEAFEKGSDRIRRMMHALRSIGHPIERYFSKLELHESGWPHWHLGVDYREFIHNDVISDAWGYGFTKTKRVTKRRDFRYLFKYVVKDNGEIPDWILDYPKRIRVFQTSVGFFAKPSSASSAKETTGEGEKRTLRVKFCQWLGRGILRVRECSYRAVPVELKRPYVETFIQRVESGARALDAFHVPLQLESLEEYILPWKPKSVPSPQPPRPHLVWDRFQMVATSSGAVRCLPRDASTSKTESPASCS